jgi:septum formation protein
MGVRHEPLLPGPDEDAEALEAVREGEAPGRYVRRVTRAKLAAAVARREARGLPDAPVLCADTTVALGADILGKPASAAEARRTLARLSGQTHRVLTAVALAWRGEVHLAVSDSRVRFETLTPARIRAYVASGEPMGKAGSYAIQGLAGTWIERIQGSHSGIMGLPVHETALLLRVIGWRGL